MSHGSSTREPFPGDNIPQDTSSSDAKLDMAHNLSGAMEPNETRTSLLATDLSDFASRLDGDAFMKMDSMLTQPCQYLDGVPGFSINDCPKESILMRKADNDQTSESLPMLSTLTMEDPSRHDDNEGTSRNTAKDGEKIDLMDSGPFLMSSDGVVFQCFPVFDKEVFIVSLDDETLLVNEDISENISAAADSVLGEKGELCVTQPSSNDVKYHKLDEVNSDVNLQEELPKAKTEENDTTLVMSHDGKDEDEITYGESEQNNIQENVNTSLPSVNFLVQEDSLKDASSDKKKNKKSKCKSDYPKNKTDGEEHPSSDWCRCYVCPKVLPSAATLRHHLVKEHNLKEIDTYMCFLCDQECWSEHQYEWHLRVQHGIKNKDLACRICGYQLSTAAECRAHVRKHLANLACPVCPVKFAANHQLVTHAKEHLQELHPHRCLLCQAYFSCKTTLQLHSWRHRSQTCPQVGCGHVAEDESWLVLHLQRDHDFSTQQVEGVGAERDKSDRKMDILITKYLKLNQHDNEPDLPHEYYTKRDDVNTISFEDIESESLLSFPHYAGSYNSDGKAQEVVTSVINSLMDAVQQGEEEIEKEDRNKKPTLRKVLEKEPSQHRCGLCNMYLPSAEELVTHKSGHSQIIECPECQKKFQSLKQLKRHMRTHRTQDLPPTPGTSQVKRSPQFTCLKCGKVCGSESALSRHQSIHSRTQGHHQCQTCKKKFRVKAHLIEHMARTHKVYHESKKLQCPMCDRKFISKAHLDSHLVTHGEREPLWSCNRCGRNYIRPRSLQRHLATHDQKFECQTCDMQFVNAHILAMHVRSHDPLHKTKYPCPNCHLKFPYKSQLAVHLRTHTGEKPFVCETCGKCFKRLQQCRVHHRMVHNKSKMSCVECGRMFGDRANLTRHRLMVHYHLKRWVCGACGHSYSYSQDLRAHLQKNHDLPFERLDSSTRKSLHEVYVIPELGTHTLSPASQATVEAVVTEERQKVRQVLSGTQQHTMKRSQTLLNTDEDPDNPQPMLEAVVGPVVGPVIGPVVGPVVTLPDLQKVTRVHQGMENMDQNLSVIGQENNMQQSVIQVRVVGVKCAECGLDLQLATPLQCGACGVMVCSTPHLDSHVASVHQVIFQCSLCGLHYGSQNECVSHVASAHSSHFLAVQGNTATYIPTQPVQPLQVTSAGAPTQMCVPLASTNTSQPCFLQVGDSTEQMPLVITSAAPGTSQQVGATNIIQYQRNNSTASNMPIVLQTTANVEREGDTVEAKANYSISRQPDTNPNLRASSEGAEVKGDSQLCTITLPMSTTEGLMLPPDNGSVVNITSGPNQLSLSSALPPERSTILVENTSTVSQADTSRPTPVLLVGSVPFSNISSEASSDVQPKPQVSTASSTSVASVLLTLAEAPSHDLTSGLVMANGLSVGRLDPIHLNPPPSTISQDQQLSHQSEGDTISPGTHTAHPRAHEVGVKQEPLEVSVEIIQSRPRRLKRDSHKLKTNVKQKIGKREATDNSSSKVASYDCKECPRKFPSAARLETHQAKHSRNFECQVCSKVFAEKFNLKTHMLSHTQDRPHACNLCERTFRYLRDLSEHKRIHEGVRPHICSVCGKGFVRYRELARHVREQHMKQQHVCAVCGASFKRKLYLEKKHMPAHHPKAVKEEKKKVCKEKQQSHICKICGRSFGQARYLTAHLRTHSRRAEYVRCPKCPRMFTSEQTLKVHNEAFHDREINCLQDHSPGESKGTDLASELFSKLQSETSNEPTGEDVSHLTAAAHSGQAVVYTSSQILQPGSGLEGNEQPAYCTSQQQPRYGRPLDGEGGRIDAMCTMHLEDNDAITYLPFTTG